MAQEKILNIRGELDELEELCQALSKSNAQMAIKTSALENRNIELEQSNREHSSRITLLQNTIEMLEDDRRQLTRVSSIVNLEKQNQSLKKEIEQLHEKINRLLAGQPTKPGVETPPEQEPPSDLIEKTIQGTSYFVDDDGLVYAKNADGSAGKRIGKLSKICGKLCIAPITQER